MKHKIKILRSILPEAIETARKRARRSLVRWRLDLLGADQDQRLQAERLLRGRERYRQLRKADAVIVSYPKSGRTWLRVMLSRLYQRIYDLPDDIVIQFDNFHHMDRRIPRLFFTHDAHIGEYIGHAGSKRAYHDKKVLLLARDPRDVAVSQFFHLRFRTKDWKREMNFYPPDDSDLGLFDFVRQGSTGLPRVIGFMNAWKDEIARTRAHEILRYEDLRADPHGGLSRVARFLNIPASPDQIQEAVDYASYENMKRKESDHGFRDSGTRLAPADQANPDSYKVRRAKVGGYRDYFDDDQIAAIDAIVAESLDPGYGYGVSRGVENAGA